MYSIKEVATLFKINANAIRFYEKKGLITPLRGDNDYRYYTYDDLSKLLAILTYRKMGFSIESIEQLLHTKSENQMLDILSAQYKYVNDHIHAMQRIRTVLGNSLESMLSTSDGDINLIENMKETAEIIDDSNRWEDLWDFNNWAYSYDTDIRKATKGLDFYAHYDEVLDQTALKATGKSIVEVGIGTGNLAKTILKKNKNCQSYIGVDQSINMLKLAKSKCPDVSVKLGTFLKLPVMDHTADTIVTSYAFHHCNSHEKILSLLEMDRVLEKGGTLIITDLMFKNDSAKHQFEQICTSKQLSELNDEFFGTVAELETALSSLGYRTETEQLDDLIWIVVGCK